MSRHRPRSHDTQSGIALSNKNVNLKWRREARKALRYCCTRYDEFTSDEVWERLEAVAPDAFTPEPSAIGPIFLWGRKQGLITKAGYQVPSKFSRRHHEMTVWKVLS